MDAAILLKTADVIFKFLGSPICKEIESIWKYEEDFKMFTDTIGLVRDVLSDLECKQIQQQSVINGYNRLREVFADAEDFIDRVQTLKKLKEADDRSFGKIRRFFGGSNQARYAYKVYNEIKKQRKQLNAIAEDLQKFVLSLNVISDPTITGPTRETGSFVDNASIIGREDDERRIMDLLLGISGNQEKIPIVSIVGIGGMGKTTVAQLVFKDENRLEKGRFDIRLWVSDSQKFDMKLLLMKILLCINPDDTSLHNLGKEQLQNRLIREIKGKKYLLVLDDVRNESRKNWLEFEGLLNCGDKESRILVTTRSREAAKVTGLVSYELKGISDDHAQQLFERTAYQGRVNESLIEIGRLIVKKCSQVPLAIKVIGCLLYGKDKNFWERVRDMDFAKIKGETNDLMPILKISYDNLDRNMRKCFQFCALFPKNAVITREILSSIWMANGCVETNAVESAEDACDDNLKMLYNRCFLEEVQSSKPGDFTQFRMHDLMHDLAREVAGEDMLVVDSGIIVDLDNKLVIEKHVRHMTLCCTTETVGRISAFEPKNTRLRTLIHHNIFTWLNPWEKLVSSEKLMSEYQGLRFLDLQNWRMENLPNSIGKLIHLRYLDLSYNEFENLPNAIVELWNLQSLLLKSCIKLKQLPADIRKLVNLRDLDLDGCSALTHMPSGMSALVFLRKLCIFIVGPVGSSDASLDDLGPLSRLQGDLVLKLPKMSPLKEPWSGGALLLNKRLSSLKIEWPDCRSVNDVQNDKKILEQLQPHSDLKDFMLYGYDGWKFPAWADHMGSVLPNLVSIVIDSSTGVMRLPSFSKLGCLRRLTICSLSDLICIEEDVPDDALFFPVLEYLWLMQLPQLESWCRRLWDNGKCAFRLLSELHIYGCPRLDMTRMPRASIRNLPEGKPDAFTIEDITLEDQLVNSMKLPWASIGSWDTSQLHWKILYIWKNSITPLPPFESVSCTFHTNDQKLMLSLPWEKFFQQNPPTSKDNTSYKVMKDFEGLLYLNLYGLSDGLVCLRLRKIPILTSSLLVTRNHSSLQELHIESCYGFKMEDESQWIQFKSLKILRLIDLEDIVELPIGVGFVTSLQVLDCSGCENLKEWPQWIANLHNLGELKFAGCNALTPTLDGIVELTTHLPNFSSFVFSNASRLYDLVLKRSPAYYLELRAEGRNDEWIRSWVPGAESTLYLPDIQHLKIEVSHTCQHLPSVCRLPYLTQLEISGSSSLEYIEERVPTELPSMRCLRLTNLPNLKGWCKGLEHLVNLRELYIESCHDFTFPYDEEMQWKELTSLERLTLKDLPKMVRLPNWIRSGRSFRKLVICSCENLLLPTWIWEDFSHVKPQSDGEDIYTLNKRFVDDNEACFSSATATTGLDIHPIEEDMESIDESFDAFNILEEDKRSVDDNEACSSSATATTGLDIHPIEEDMESIDECFDAFLEED